MEAMTVGVIGVSHGMPDLTMVSGRCVVVMGVSACGKTSFAGELASKLSGWSMLDADRLHPPENWTKIVSGVSISDDEREVFFQRLVDEVRTAVRAGRDVVLSWSALRQEHRERFRQEIPATYFVFLEVDEATATARSVARKAADPSQPGPGIVPGQFAALERPGPPEPALTIPVGGSSDEVVRLLRRAKFLDQR